MYYGYNTLDDGHRQGYDIYDVGIPIAKGALRFHLVSNRLNLNELVQSPLDIPYLLNPQPARHID
jgi:hypothetical protein